MTLIKYNQAEANGLDTVAARLGFEGSFDLACGPQPSRGRPS
jgi:hypothetical protein